MRYKIRYLVIFSWFIFTVSLAIWWLIFSLQQIERLQVLDHNLAENLIRYQKMLFWEGSTLLLSLLFGGSWLFFLAIREAKQSKQVKEFLATFTHELKTPLAGLRLQTEILKDKLSHHENRLLVDRLITSFGRLNLMLENSLHLSTRSSEDVLKEPILVTDVVNSVKEYWPNIDIQINSDEKVLADRRILESIFSNLFQNSVQHGDASFISIDVKEFLKDKVKIIVLDNGKDFKADIKNLGRLFYRHYQGSGSGIGLYLVKSLIKKLGGSFDAQKTSEGFRVEIVLDRSK